MRVSVLIHGVSCHITAGVWTSDNADVADYLNAMTPFIDVPTSEPFPDHAIAREVVSGFSDARIIDYTQPAHVDGRVY